MKAPLARSILAVVALACAPREARALDSETFDDYRSVGKSPDSRKAPDPIAVENAIFEPRIRYKIFDVVTPHVYGAESVGYTDNELHDESDVPGIHPVHTPFSRTTGGVRADVQLEDHVIELGYQATDSYYVNAPDGDRNIFEHGANGRIDLNFNEWNIHADGSWARSVFPTLIQLTGLAREDAETTQEWVNWEGPNVGAKVGFYFRRDFFTDKQPDLQQFDHKTYGVSAQVNLPVPLGEKFRALFEYNFEDDEFDFAINRGFAVHQLRVGVDGQLTPKITLSIKIGGDCQIPEPFKGTHGGGYNGFAAACSAAWQILPQVQLQAAYRRDLTFAVGVGATFETIDTVDLGLLYTFGPEEKLYVHPSFSWEHAVQNNNGGADRIHALASFGYKILEWLTSQVTYEYTQVIGTGGLKTSSYDEHRVEVTIAFGL